MNLTAKRITSRQKEKPRPHGIEESVGAGKSFPGSLENAVKGSAAGHLPAISAINEVAPTLSSMPRGRGLP